MARHPPPQAPRSLDLDDDSVDYHSRHRMPKMDVPRFDGEHPKLWQLQCEDYFEMYNTTPHMWVRLASLQFHGPAARWLSSVKSSICKFTWLELCQEVVVRFGRNRKEICPRGNNNIVIIIFLVHDNVYTPC
jgi:hypothetical protein